MWGRGCTHSWLCVGIPHASHSVAPHPDAHLCPDCNSTPLSQNGQDFILPLCCPDTLRMLGIGKEELTELCSACTHFVRFVVDQVRHLQTRASM